MSKKAKPTLEDVFEFPKENKDDEGEDCCKVPKMPQKYDPEFEKDVKNYLADVKKAVAAEKQPQSAKTM